MKVELIEYFDELDVEYENEGSRNDSSFCPRQLEERCCLFCDGKGWREEQV